MVELNLLVSDLSFRERVGYTYERDDGLTCSLIAHITCLQHMSSIISDIYAVHCGSIL